MSIPLQFLVPVSEIICENDNPFDQKQIQLAAQFIINSGRVLNPPVLRRIGVDSYELLNGAFEYFAAVEAKILNPQQCGNINAYIVEPGTEQAIMEQIKLFRSVEQTIPFNPLNLNEQLMQEEELVQFEQRLESILARTAIEVEKKQEAFYNKLLAKLNEKNAASSNENVLEIHPLHEAKLILIGDGAAGKTSLMKRLLGQAFDPQESQTHGININTLSLLDPHHNAIKLHCWDFGGQQIMHATHQFFLSKRCLYLLVIDSRRESQVEYWLKHIQTFGDHAPVIIVINKIDENPHFDLPQPRQLKQRYPNLKHIHRLSCRTDQGLPELNHLIQDTLPAIDLINTMIPGTWFNVKTAIAEQAQRSNFASYEQYVDLCASHGINSASEQTTLINFLHDLGCIHHFPDRWLRETNVINPQWLTEAVYTIINAPQLAGHGKLHRHDLINLLDHTLYPERKHDYILELMQKFELCYAINENEYLLPDLFPVTEPDFNFDSSHALQFIVEYDFLPKSVFTRLVIKLHHAIVPNAYWRTGVLLRDANSNTVALIETTTNPNRITFQISGPQQQEYLVILRFMLQDINHSFNQLTITEQILGVVTQPTATELLSGINKIIQMLETQGFKEEKDLRDHLDDVINFNPSIFGVSVNVNALLKKAWPR